MNDVFLVDGVRTPVGRYGGALAHVRADDLAAAVIAALVERTGVSQIDDVVLGAANQSGEDNRNVARMAALLAGLDETTPGFTVNRLCASGLQAIASAAAEIRSNESSVVIAGGAESMSRAPMVAEKADEPKDWVNTALGWRFVNPRMAALDGGDATLSLGACTEKLAALDGITREESDVFAASSQQRAAQAWEDGVFTEDVIAVDGVTRDETVRGGTTVEVLAELKPSFGGVVTAGNASPLSDGASAVLVANADAVAKSGLTPRAKVLGYAVAGVAPSLFGLGPVPAIEKLLARHGLSVSQIDVFEINEAFAAQTIACQRRLGIDREKLNAEGGAIALGHPLGSSGSRLMLQALGRLERTGGRYAVVSLCIGVGQGAAMLIERVTR